MTALSSLNVACAIQLARIKAIQAYQPKPVLPLRAHAVQVQPIIPTGFEQGETRRYFCLGCGNRLSYGRCVTDSCSRRPRPSKRQLSLTWSA